MRAGLEVRTARVPFTRSWLVAGRSHSGVRGRLLAPDGTAREEDGEKVSDLSAQTIRRLSLVSPFEERGVQNGMSYGLSSASYDVRSAVDCILWPKCSRLIWTIEHISLPPHINGKVYNKSTWARSFVDFAKTTFIDPGFRGALQIEITNHCWFRTYRLRKGDAVAQIVFTFLDEPTQQPYAGKYQDQEGAVVGPRMERPMPKGLREFLDNEPSGISRGPVDSRLEPDEWR